MSGLFKMLAQMRNGGFVVESLADGRRVPVSSTQRIIMLSDISVFTVEDDIPLREVFLKMKEKEKVASSVDAKSDPYELKDTLKKILPDFDEERVHASDIRKMFVWFNLLKDKVDFTAPAEEEPAEVTGEEKPEKKEKKEKKEAKETKEKTLKAEEKAKETKEKTVKAEKATETKEKPVKAEKTTEPKAPAKKTAAKKTAAKKKKEDESSEEAAKPAVKKPSAKKTASK